MNLLLILLTAHFLADFYFQSASLAQQKEKSASHMRRHGLEYASVMAVVIFSFITTGVDVKLFLVIGISHFLIDCTKAQLDNNKNFNQWYFYFFCIDQVLHIGIIIFSFYFFNVGSAENSFFTKITESIPWDQWAHYLLLFVILWSPSSILVKKLMDYVFREKKPTPNLARVRNNKVRRRNEVFFNQGEASASAGSMIGKLERVVISMLIIYGEAGAIGFVVAVKSIARYKQFENQRFTEKFLVGTLASTSIAILATKLLIG